MQSEQRGSRHVQIGTNAAEIRRSCAHLLGEDGAQVGDSAIGASGDRQHGHRPQAVLDEQPPEVGDAGGFSLDVEEIDLVEDHEHDVVVTVESPQIQLVQDVVGVLLRVDDPDEQVNEPDEAVDLHSVLDRRRVEVRQIEQDETVEVVVGRHVQLAVTGDLVASRNVEPIEKCGCALAPPDARQRRVGRRTAHSYRRQVEPDEGVEQGRLPAAGSARESDDRVLARQLQPLAGARHQRASRVDRRSVESSLGAAYGAVEGVQPYREVGAHRDRSCSTSLSAADSGRLAANGSGRARPSSTMRPVSASSA